jgi:DNA polymerase alpha-primase complex, polymerase-associated subunit B
MTYQPLEDLVEYIVEYEPHVVILIGPFVDITHPHVASGLMAETFQACFEKMVSSLMEPLKM